MNKEKTAVLLMRENPIKSPDPYKIKELRGLADAAGYRVLAEIFQRRSRDFRFQMGKGKIEQALSYNPEKLIFYNALSPNQVFNIRSEFSAQVLDRFNLILEIFSSRASTREAKLQVELARLSYDAPKVKNALAMKKRGEQPGFRGAGAYEQSMYHDIRGRMAKIRAELNDVENMGEDRRQRRREQGFDLVALAGYTNAGKSTLLNALTGSAVEAKDQPFTTLSPTTRALEVLGRKVLLTDTVGFIDDLPHFLIKAFRSTLSEISEADLVLLVADISEPLELLRRKLAASHKALWDCDVTSPIVTILNKADRLAEGEAAREDGSDQRSGPLSGSGLGFYRPGPGRAGRVHLSAFAASAGVRDQPALHLTGPLRAFRLYETAELLAVRYEEELIVRLRGRKETVARALSGARRL